MKNYKVEIYAENLHTKSKFEDLGKATRYAEIMKSIDPSASIILYERHWLFWWKEYEESDDE